MGRTSKETEEVRNSHTAKIALCGPLAQPLCVWVREFKSKSWASQLCICQEFKASAERCSAGQARAPVPTWVFVGFGFVARLEAVPFPRLGASGAKALGFWGAYAALKRRSLTVVDGILGIFWSPGLEVSLSPEKPHSSRKEGLNGAPGSCPTLYLAESLKASAERCSAGQARAPVPHGLRWARLSGTASSRGG